MRVDLGRIWILYMNNEYVRYSKMLRELQLHIDILYRDGIMSHIERNTNLKAIHDIIKELNNQYNNNIEVDCNNIKISQNYDNDDDLLLSLRMDRILNKGKSKMLSDLINEPFVIIEDELLKIMNIIGFTGISKCMELMTCDVWMEMYDRETIKKINIYNSIFKVLQFKAYDDHNFTGNVIIKKGNTTREVVIQNCYDIIIKCMDGNVYLFNGFFMTDPVNLVLRTLQINDENIFNKKKDIETFIINKGKIPDKFVRTYIKSANIGDIMALNRDEFYAQILDDYNNYVKLNKMSFMNLMKEFVKEELSHRQTIMNMYKIIKMLLLGTDENMNVAGLLFSMTKDKKQENDNIMLLSVSDVIYNNLNFVLQSKLKKSSLNIKHEIARIKSMSLDDVDLKKQVSICKNMPLYVKKLAYDKIEEMKSLSNEYYKQLLYVKTLLNFPWASHEDDIFFEEIKKDRTKGKELLDNVIQKLNNKVYGHKECKQTIKEELGKWISNPSSAGSVIGLSGPPGVGKTLIAKAIGQALNIPFVQITLGGQNDADLLHGHGYTYTSSQPGMIVKKMIEAGSARCIIYFDELDKACKKHSSNEIYNTLIHIVDPNTNNEFEDRFFQEVKFPLNKVLFVFSYNDSSLVDNILMDRIREIEVKPFKLSDKKNIINEYILNEMSELVGFDKNVIKLADDNIEYIIQNYTNEAGVRDLKRKIEKIFLKLNIDRIYGINNFDTTFTLENPLYIDKSIIEDCLGKNHIHIQYIHEKDSVGVINGLYATDSGSGGILPIQIYDNYTSCDEKFTLKLTGSQKRVMRESVISAFTTAIHLIKEDIRRKYIKEHPHGFHIHTPSTSVPKDGPSAGCAFATAFVSRILNKKIKHDIAITGEIELTGKITKIGGLQYKIQGAKQAGVKKILVSLENSDDIDNLKKEYTELFDDSFEIILVDNLHDVLNIALIDYEQSQII
jgi:endopeptidase La